jgi:hypothetical protein
MHVTNGYCFVGTQLFSLQKLLQEESRSIKRNSSNYIAQISPSEIMDFLEVCLQQTPPPPPSHIPI